MTNQPKSAGIAYFVSRANNLIHETTKPFYRFRSEYPINDDLLKKCSILSAAYYFRRKGIQPTLSIVEDLGMSEEEFREVQVFYERFSEDPRACFYDYSFEVEKLIKESAQSRGALGYIMVPQFCGKRREIDSYLSFSSMVENAPSDKKN